MKVFLTKEAKDLIIPTGAIMQWALYSSYDPNKVSAEITEPYATAMRNTPLTVLAVVELENPYSGNLHGYLLCKTGKFDELLSNPPPSAVEWIGNAFYKYRSGNFLVFQPMEVPISVSMADVVQGIQ